MKISWPNMGLAAAITGLFASAPAVNFTPTGSNHGSRNGQNKTGKKYPFSSDRQHKRYARQIAAGQLCYAKK